MGAGDQFRVLQLLLDFIMRKGNEEFGEDSEEIDKKVKTE